MATCSVCNRTIQPGEWAEGDDQGGLSHSECRHGRRIAPLDDRVLARAIKQSSCFQCRRGVCAVHVDEEEDA